MRKTFLALTAFALLVACSSTPDTAQTLADLDQAYVLAGKTAVAAIQANKLTPEQTVQAQLTSHIIATALEQATTGLAACPRAGNTIDPTCANSAVITSALTTATTQLITLNTLIGAK